MSERQASSFRFGSTLLLLQPLPRIRYHQVPMLFDIKLDAILSFCIAEAWVPTRSKNRLTQELLCQCYDLIV
jgi:hypothetical protein